MLGSAEPILWRSFRFLAAGNFPNTPTPRGGGTKKIRISNFAKVCVLLDAVCWWRRISNLTCLSTHAFPVQRNVPSWLGRGRGTLVNPLALTAGSGDQRQNAMLMILLAWSCTIHHGIA